MISASRSVLWAAAAALVAMSTATDAAAGDPPFASRPSGGVKVVDLSDAARPAQPAAAATKSLSDLDALRTDGPDYDPALPGTSVPLPPGKEVDPDVIFAVEDIPGNKYPRKATLYMNFVGEDLKVGADNSAENKSTLADQGPYPAFGGGEQTAIAAAQQMANDVSQFGIRVVFDPRDRPPKILPYTMAMIGGQWQDTNLDEPAAGVAPGTDCGALGQRHVVYTFASGGWSATAVANVTAQEAGHAWGLDHSNNCSSVMSYCGGGGDGHFSSSCDGLCEQACQGFAGCRSFHEMFCGEGNDQQNEAAELEFLFGTNAPDIEPPTVEIVSPEDGLRVPAGSDVDLRAIVDDDYGGFGFAFLIARDGEVLLDQVAYDRGDYIDEEYRAALNLVNLEPGTYDLSVRVRDHGDNETIQTATVVVTGEGEGADDGEDAGEDGTADGGGLDESGGDGVDNGDVDDGTAEGIGETTDADDDGGAETGDGTGADTAGVDDGLDKPGCACTARPSGATAGASNGGWWMLGLVLPWALGARRRRRG